MLTYHLLCYSDFFIAGYEIRHYYVGVSNIVLLNINLGINMLKIVLTQWRIGYRAYIKRNNEQRYKEQRSRLDEMIAANKEKYGSINEATKPLAEARLNAITKAVESVRQKEIARGTYKKNFSLLNNDKSKLDTIIEE